MFQMGNIIRVDEGGASAPYIVHERLSSFATPTLRDGHKLIREQRGPEASLLICCPIIDATFEDIVPPVVPVSPEEPVAEVKQEPGDTYNQTVTDNNGNTNKTEEVIA